MLRTDAERDPAPVWGPARVSSGDQAVGPGSASASDVDLCRAAGADGVGDPAAFRRWNSPLVIPARGRHSTAKCAPQPYKRDERNEQSDATGEQSARPASALQSATGSLQTMLSRLERSDCPFQNGLEVTHRAL